MYPYAPFGKFELVPTAFAVEIDRFRAKGDFMEVSGQRTWLPSGESTLTLILTRVKRESDADMATWWLEPSPRRIKVTDRNGLVLYDAVCVPLEYRYNLAGGLGFYMGADCAVVETFTVKVL